MATPPDVTIKAMSGKFILNVSVSDSLDEILRLQGVSWFKRRAISMFVPTLYVRHTTDEASVEHISIDQMLSGGLPGTLKETRTLDWHERNAEHDLFGPVTGKSRKMPVAEITDEFLGEGWVEDTVVMCDHRSTPGKNSYTWKAVQTWGFAIVDGKRRYVRRTTFTSPEKRDGPIHARLVYDYVGTV